MILDDAYLVMVVQILGDWRGRLCPQELSSVREISLKNVGCCRRVVVDLLPCGRVGLEHDIDIGDGVHRVAVLLALSQFAANKSDCNHSAVTSYHDWLYDPWLQAKLFTTVTSLFVI